MIGLLGKSRPRRRSHKADTNQKDIVKGLKDVGASVMILDGTIDILVGWHRANLLMEIKKDQKATFKPSQVEFFRDWKGQVVRVNSLKEALAVLGIRSSGDSLG